MDDIGVAVKVETMTMYDVTRNVEDEKERTKHRYLENACGQRGSGGGAVVDIEVVRLL